MKAHRNLKVTGKRETLETIVQRIAATASGEWERARDREDSIRHQLTASSAPMYAFECTRKAERPHASLWLALDHEAQELRVTQIVPAEDEASHIDVDECNAVVTSFHDDLLEPAARGLGVHVEFTGEEDSPEVILNKESAQYLRAFASGANKNTGSAHPNDRARWFRFIMAAHRDGAEFSATALAQWLGSDGGFDEEVADELATEYELARHLLTAYDKSRKGQ